MASYLRNHSMPQSHPISPEQVQNNAGGYVWQADDFSRLESFLILGAEGGSYYASQESAIAENIQCIKRCIRKDGAKTVDVIVNVSTRGRAPKQDPALYALATCASAKDEVTRRAALAALPKVARTATHLFMFLGFVREMRGWGTLLRRAVAAWYEQPARKIAYQAVKYRNREGWTHRDALRLAHPHAPTEQHRIIYDWICRGWTKVGFEPHPDPALRQIWAYERAKRAESVGEVCHLIRNHRLTHEMVPSQWLGERKVWEALLPEMPIGALVRNLATMTRRGLLTPLSRAERLVREALADRERIRNARLHPFSVLTALKTYASGVGQRSAATWTPLQSVVDALDGAFELAFDAVEPTGQRWLLALDVSGSMTWDDIGGVPGLTPRVASAAMAMVTARREPQHHIMGFSDHLVPIPVGARDRLDRVVQAIERTEMGGTDCALPMLWARKNRIPVDVFVVYTDKETWYGRVHPAETLRRYRRAMQIPAKLIVVGMVSNGFSLADPNDPGMLDIVGFDTAAPQIMAAFAQGGQ